MTKKRRSVSLDPEIDEMIEDDEAAFAPMVNRWCHEYYAQGNSPSMDRERLVRMLDELDDVEAEFESSVSTVRKTIDNQRQMVKEALGDAPTADGELQRAIDEVHKQLTPKVGTDKYAEDMKTPREPDNPAVRAKAGNIGITPEHLADELRRRDRRDAAEPQDGDGGQR